MYGTIISPLLQRHETEIDRCLDEGKARVGDAAYTAYQRLAPSSSASLLRLLISSLPACSIVLIIS